MSALQLLFVFLCVLGDLGELKASLARIPQQSNGEAVFRLLDKALDAASPPKIGELGEILYRNVGTCNATQKQALATKFEGLALRSLQSTTTSLTERAEIASFAFGMFRDHVPNVEREIFWARKVFELIRSWNDGPARDEEKLTAMVTSTINLCNAHMRAGQLAKAVQTLDETKPLIDYTAKSSASLNYMDFRSNLFSRIGRIRESEELVRAMLQRRDLKAHKRIDLYLNLSIACRSQLRFAESLVAIEKAETLLANLENGVESKPLVVKLNREKAKWFKHQGRMKEALESIDIVLAKIKTGYPISIRSVRSLLMDRAYCLAILGKHIDALDQIQSCERLMPPSPKNDRDRRSWIVFLNQYAFVARVAAQFDVAKRKSLDALSRFRQLEEPTDELLISCLQHAATAATHEEKFLLSLEGAASRQRLGSGSVTIKVLHGEWAFSEHAGRQGMRRDCLAICRRILDHIETLPDEQKSIYTYRMLAVSCMLDLGEFRKIDAMLQKHNLEGTRLAMERFPFDVAIALEAFKDGEFEIANRYLQRVFDEQIREFTSDVDRAVADLASGFDSSTATYLTTWSPKRNNLAANARWIDESTGMVRLHAHANRYREGQTAGRLDGGRFDPATSLLPRIQQRLTTSDVLVVYSPYVPQDAISRNCVFVVTRDAVERHELGRLWDLHVAKKEFELKLKTGQNDFEAAKRLGELLGIPHLELDGKKRLFVATGETDTIPFAALVDADGKRVIEKVAVIHTSAMVALVNQRPLPNAGSKEVLAIGDVDFGTPGSNDEYRVDWKPLPATKDELASIKDVAGERSLTQLTGRKATKREVLQAASKARTLHFATHASVLNKTYSEFDPPGDPLKLSAVVLAGANDRGPSAALTGVEVCRMDLQNADLVVLAACNTALGAEYADHSTASLRDAFHVAGARNVISSLWRVNDEATAAFMKLLYVNLWQENLPPHEAFRQAQVTLYRNPALIPDLARERGPDFKRVLRKAKNAKPQGKVRTPVRLWAAFQFSGMGGLK